MASGSKLNAALQLILDDLIETNSANTGIEIIEAENAQLRKKKIELMAKLNHHSTVNSSIILVKDMLSRQQNLNHVRSESKEHAAIRFRSRSQEAAAQVASWKQKMQEADHLITLPHNEVQHKLLDMEEKITANHAKINELSREHKKLTQSHKEEDQEILNLNETLKCVEEEQRKIIEKLNKLTTT